MSRLRIWVGLLALALALPLAGAGAASAAAADKVVLGMPVKPPPMIHLPVYYAIDNGIFNKYGLDVKVKFFRGGVATHRAATSAKSGLDAAWVPGPIGMSGIARGSGLKFFHSFAFRFEAQIAAAPGIDTPAKLRGRTIGIEGRGGYSHLAALAVLEPAGLKDADVKYIKTPPPARVPFLVKKKADAVAIHVEQVLLAQKLRPGVVALANLWKARPHYFYAGFLAPASKLKSRREVYVRFAMAMMQSTRSVYKDKAGFLRTANKWMKGVYKKYPGLLSQTYDTFVRERLWAVNSGLPKAWIDWTNKFNTRLGKYKGAPPSYGKLIDVGIAKEALAKAGPVEPSEN